MRKASTTRAEAFAQNDAVDVSDIEMVRRGLDRECADDAGPFAECDGQCGIGAAATDQQHGCVPREIDIGQCERRCRLPAHHGGMQ